ncbi:MAG TPA: tRNA (adenosine(37)-N6)-threonylcarbamoyltransferase complex ATPase subunit type 1 TsaE [Chitinophagaceae bacterium]
MLKTFKIDEIDSIARSAWEEGKDYKTWVFDAPMGAGKTTFIHALCELLQVKDTVGSPTFALINEYSSPVAGTICHMDWYRLKDEQEAVDAGMEDAILGGNYCFIEWPEKAAALLPDERFTVRIRTIDENTREISTLPGALPKIT